MTTTLVNACSFIAASSGSGNFVFGQARKSWLTPAQAVSSGQLSDGQTVAYVAEDKDNNPTQRAWGHGVFTAATNTITRDASEQWSDNGSTGTGPLNFSRPPIVLLTVLASDITVGGGNTYYVSSSGSDSKDGLTTTSAWKTIAKVNAATFQPGDTILFAAGQTFSGAIVCPSSGTPSRPITFGSYGGGQATISSGAASGFSSTSQPGIIVRNLTFTGTTPTTNIPGILFYNPSAGNVHFQNIQVINCNISGYGSMGIWVLGGNGTSGYDDVLIQGCVVSSCCSIQNAGNGTAGIFVQSPPGSGYGSATKSFKNVIVDNCKVNSCTGASDTNWTGSGIVLAEVDGGVISNCEANGNGANAISSGPGGPVGIWTFDSTRVVIDSCKTIGQQTGNVADGGGFDIDGGCSDCEIRNCYSSGNAGPGFLISSYNDGTVTTIDKVRILNCVSDADGVGASNASPDGISIFAGASATLTNVRVSGCTVNNPQTNAIAFRGANVAAITGIVAGNTLSVAASQTYILAKPAGVTVQGNTQFSAINGLVLDKPAPFFVTTGAAGSFTGSYVRLDSDTQNRVFFALNGGDNPLAAFGPGGSTAADIALIRPAVATLGIVKDPYSFGAGPTTLQLYNTLDAYAPTNYERGVFDWTTSSNVLTIGTQKGGTGSPRSFQFVYGGTSVMDYNITNAGCMTVTASGSFPLVMQNSDTTFTSFSLKNTSAGGKLIVFYSTGSANGLGAGHSGVYNQTDSVVLLDIDPTGNVVLGGSLKTATSLTTNLPAAGTAGIRHFVTDTSSAAVTFGSTISSGGGTFKAPIYDDGSKWRYG